MVLLLEASFICYQINTGKFSKCIFPLPPRTKSLKCTFKTNLSRFSVKLLLYGIHTFLDLARLCQTTGLNLTEWTLSDMLLKLSPTCEVYRKVVINKASLPNQYTNWRTLRHEKVIAQILKKWGKTFMSFNDFHLALVRNRPTLHNIGYIIILLYFPIIVTSGLCIDVKFAKQ